MLPTARLGPEAPHCDGGNRGPERFSMQPVKCARRRSAVPPDCRAEPSHLVADRTRATLFSLDPDCRTLETCGGSFRKRPFLRKNHEHTALTREQNSPHPSEIPCCKPHAPG